MPPSLRIKKAAGLDRIPPILIRDSEAELVPSITYLLNKSIEDETVPALWKVACATPLYKSEEKLLVEYYRPISVLPVLSKIMERVVHKQMSAYLDRLGFLYRHQYGFRRGHNTTQAVGQLNNWVLEAMDGGKLTSLLFVGISKDFDSINLGKLELSQMSGRTLGWFKSYLADRQQSVYVNGEFSETHQIALGFP